MKIVGSKLNGDGQRVYEITLGKNELKLICDLVQNFYVSTPRVFETTSVRNRANNILSEINKLFEKEI